MIGKGLHDALGFVRGRNQHQPVLVFLASPPQLQVDADRAADGVRDAIARRGRIRYQITGADDYGAMRRRVGGSRWACGLWSM